MRIGKKMSMVLHNLKNRFDHYHCHYPLALDPYSGACPFKCSYCYAREQSSVSPCTPNDLDHFFSDLKQALMARPKGQLQQQLARRYPLRIGVFSDPLPPLEEELGHTLRLLQVLKQNSYPFTLITKSPLIARAPYLELLSSSHSAIQISLSFAEDKWRQQIEPHAPSIESRLRALEILVECGLDPTVRINPLYPLYPDGTFTKGLSLDPDNELPFFSLSLFKKLEQIGVRHLVAGFISSPSFHYSKEEIVAYLSFLKEEAKKYQLSLSACYLGGSPTLFSKLSALSDDPNDCCNLQQRFNFDLSHPPSRSLTTKLIHTFLTRLVAP